MSELENMTLLELRNFAQEQNIKNISKLKKEELVVLLRQVAETSKPQEKTKERTINSIIKTSCRNIKTTRKATRSRNKI